MIRYTTEIVNAIARYQVNFGYRIRADEANEFASETAMVAAIDDAIAKNNPKYGGTARTKPLSKKKKPTNQSKKKKTSKTEEKHENATGKTVVKKAVVRKKKEKSVCQESLKLQ